jgi:nucleotide-binding universal stress UspA family protein
VIPSGTIVVGVDGSSSAERALEWAIEQAVLEHRPLTIAYGVGSAQTVWIDQAGFDHGVALDAMREDARAILDEARALVTRHAPQVEVHQVYRLTDPREMLLNLSKEAAMVVVGSRGRGPVKSLLLGSVSVAVTRHAKCPVVVLRPRNSDAVRRGVLVGADGTEDSLPTLEFAYRQASLRKLPLTVMHCFWDVRSATSSLTGGPESEEERPLLAEALDRMGEKFPDVNVRLELARGLADACLIGAGERMDMVVVGRHEQHMVSGLVYGSIASAVVEHASCIVAVVPHVQK